MFFRDVGHDLTYFCADFPSICRCFIYESVGEVLKFTIAAAHKIDVVGKSEVAYGPPTDGGDYVVAIHLRGLGGEEISGG